MVRIATVNDAEQLNILNDEFNGESETSIDNIRNSLMNNKQEVVIVADEDDMLVGFVCVQLKKSFCYDEYMPEITEVYVKPAYRKRGLASEMITFAEAYCSKNYPLHQYELLTGQENLVAQTVYNKLGYVDDNELHLSKRVKRQSNPNLRRCSYVWITYIEFRNTVRDDFCGIYLMIDYRTMKQNVDRILGLEPEEQTQQQEQKSER